MCLLAYRTHLAEQSLLAGLEHPNHLEQILARTERSDVGYAEGLMLDVYERMVEDVFSNLLLVLDGALMAPDLRRCSAVGVMCTELPERAKGIGVPLVIRDISTAELATADEAFLCSNQFGIWSVRALDGHIWPVGKPTRKLQDQFHSDLDF